MQLLCRDETQPRLRQIPCRVVAGRDLVEEVDLQVLPIAAFDDFFFLAEVIEQVGGAGAGGVHLGVAALMFGGDVRHVVGDLHQFSAAVVRLDDDALLRLGDVMLEADHLLEAERLPEFGGQLHGLVVDRVRPVESDQRTGPVVAAEEFRHGHDPQRVVRVVRAEEDRDLEVDVHAQFVEQETEQDRPGVEVEHVLDAVVGVVVEELVQPLQGVFIRFADAAEITRDRGRPAEVRVRAVRAFGVQRLDEGRADNVQRGDDGGQVAVCFGFFHPADCDESSGDECLVRDGLLGHGAHPREILQGRDFERDRVFILEFHRVCRVAQNLSAIILYGDERAALALFDQPLQILERLGVALLDDLEEIFHLARNAVFAIDLLRRAVFGNHREEILHHLRIGVEQNGVEGFEFVGGNFE